MRDGGIFIYEQIMRFIDSEMGSYPPAMFYASVSLDLENFITLRQLRHSTSGILQGVWSMLDKTQISGVMLVRIYLSSFIILKRSSKSKIIRSKA